MTRSRAEWLTLCAWRTSTSDLTPALPGALGVHLVLEGKSVAAIAADIDVSRLLICRALRPLELQ